MEQQIKLIKGEEAQPVSIKKLGGGTICQDVEDGMIFMVLDTDDAVDLKTGKVYSGDYSVKVLHVNHIDIVME